MALPIIGALRSLAVASGRGLAMAGTGARRAGEKVLDHGLRSVAGEISQAGAVGREVAGFIHRRRGQGPGSTAGSRKSERRRSQAVTIDEARDEIVSALDRAGDRLSADGDKALAAVEEHGLEVARSVSRLNDLLKRWLFEDLNRDRPRNTSPLAEATQSPGAQSEDDSTRRSPLLGLLRRRTGRVSPSRASRLSPRSTAGRGINLGTVARGMRVIGGLAASGVAGAGAMLAGEWAINQLFGGTLEENRQRFLDEYEERERIRKLEIPEKEERAIPYLQRLFPTERGESQTNSPRSSASSAGARGRRRRIEFVGKKILFQAGVIDHPGLRAYAGSATSPGSGSRVMDNSDSDSSRGGWGRGWMRWLGFGEGDDSTEPSSQPGSSSAIPTQSSSRSDSGGGETSAARGSSSPAASSDNIVLANQGIRSDPVAPELMNILEYARQESGVDEVRVISGGQMSKAEAIRRGARQVGNKWYLNGQAIRIGSTRHDEGGAADVDLYKDGRRLLFTNPEDRPYFESFVRSSARAGATGIGAGSGYMGPGRIHVGGGSSTTWGGAGSWLTRSHAAGRAEAETFDLAEHMRSNPERYGIHQQIAIEPSIEQLPAEERSSAYRDLAPPSGSAFSNILNREDERTALSSVAPPERRRRGRLEKIEKEDDEIRRRQSIAAHLGVDNEERTSVDGL